MKMEKQQMGIGTIDCTIPVPTPFPLRNVEKKSWWRRMAPCLAFLAAFSTAMALLLIWSEITTLRRQAFDITLRQDYKYNLSMDNVQLAAYIREVQFKPVTHQDTRNVSKTREEEFLINFFQGKREGIYLEYINRIGGSSTTGYLEANYGWRGVVVLTDVKSFFEICRSNRSSSSRVLNACLSTDKDTKEISYQSEVHIIKLGEGANSLFLSDEGLMRLKCFPLYTVLLAYNQTTLNYLSIDSTDSSDIQVLDTIPWDIIRVNVIFIHWNTNHSELELKKLIKKLKNKKFNYLKSTESGKLIFIDSNFNLKI